MLDFSPYAYEFHEDPYPIYARLRREAPVYYNDEIPEVGPFWALSRYTDVLDAFKDTRRFSNRHGVSIDPGARGPGARRGTSFLGMDPPEHTRFRGVVSRSFTPRRIAALEPRIRDLTRRHLDALKDRGGFCAIADFAGKLPMDVISEMLGVPETDRDALRKSADDMVHREDGVFDITPECARGFLDIRAYMERHLEKLRRQPGDDLLSALVAQSREEEDLDQEFLLSFCNLMVVAGNETTTKLLGNGLYWLWRHPEQRALVEADRSLIPGWVEETLRFDNSTQMLMRVTTEDVKVRGRTIPEGSNVLLLVGSANRDPEVFEDPDRYDVRRDASAMLSFGKGVHFCMGASLARLEARVAFEEWVARFPDYAIEPEGIVRVHSVNVKGFSALPIRI